MCLLEHYPPTSIPRGRVGKKIYIYHKKCSISSKKDRKKKEETQRHKSGLMLPYHVISMDACLIRLTTVTGAQNKLMRSISLGCT